MIEWIQANWADILIIFASAISIASVIVKITPNETDNKWLAYIIKIFEAIGLNTTPVNSKK
jgi:hypothetical protein